MKNASALVFLGLILSLYLSGCGDEEVKSRPANNPTPTTGSVSEQQRRQATLLDFPNYGISFSRLKEILLNNRLDPSLTEKFSLEISETDPNTLTITTNLGEAANVTLSEELISRLRTNGLVDDNSDGKCQASIEYKIVGTDGAGGYSVERSVQLGIGELVIQNSDSAHFGPSGNAVIPNVAGDYTIDENLEITTPEVRIIFNKESLEVTDPELIKYINERSNLFNDFVNGCIGEALAGPVTDDIGEMLAVSREHKFE